LNPLIEVNLAEVSLVFLTCSRQKPEDSEKIFATRQLPKVDRRLRRRCEFTAEGADISAAKAFE
jgi:hypothetical protein